MDKVKVTTKLTFEDFRKVNFYLTYRKGVSKFSLGIGTFLLLGTLTFYMLEPDFYTQFPILPIALGLAMTILPTYSVLRTSKKNYNSDSRISETVSYEFDNDVIEISGASFHSKLTWDKIYELTVTKSWVLIWQNGQVANVISRRDMDSNQIQELKNITEIYPSIKKK